jgi:hypothetical protein
MRARMREGGGLTVVREGEGVGEGAVVREGTGTGVRVGNIEVSGIETGVRVGVVEAVGGVGFGGKW